MCRPTLQNASELRQKRLRHGPKLAPFGIMNTVLKIFVQHHGGPFREASVLVGHVTQKCPNSLFGFYSFVIISNKFGDRTLVIPGPDRKSTRMTSSHYCESRLTF